MSPMPTHLPPDIPMRTVSLPAMSGIRASSRPRRGPTVERGRKAEDAACAILRQWGFEILERNLRIGGVEVDVVARDGEFLVFVEVRSRSSRRHGAPWESVGPAKQARIVRAAGAYLASVPGPAPQVRFDVVGVQWSEGAPLCTVFKGAFEARSGSGRFHGPANLF